jgi:RND family efflux transporter MFP subunit
MRTATILLATALLPMVVLVAGCSRQQAAPEPVRAVRTVTIAPQTAAVTLEYAAEVKARTESRLSFRIGGKIVKRQAQFGDAVKAGQVLAQLDPQDLKLSQDAAKAALSAARASREQAEADWKRFRELRDQGFISSAELERRDVALKSARAQADQAYAQSSAQANQTAYAALIADTSGVITGIDAEPGMVVGSGTPVVRLAHDGPRDAVFSVPEDKIELLRTLAGKPDALKVKLWGNGGEIFAATLREVAAAADPMTRTFLVKADVGRAPARLGQTATVIVDAGQQAGVVKLPLAAVTEVQGKTSVWLLDPATMTVQPRPVQVAGADGNAVVIAAGLQPGERVVTAGVHVLTPGLKVRPYVEPSSTAVAGQ